MGSVIRMPQLAAGGDEAAVQSWLVDVGDTVSVGQAIAEIETEKAVVEYQAEIGGTLAGLLVAVGEQAAVGAPIAVIAADGETAEQALADADAGTPVSESLAPDAPGGREARPATASETTGTGTSAHRVFASPLVRRLARERGIDLAAVPGSGPRGRIVRRDLDALSVAPAPDAVPPASPSVPVAPAGGYTDIPHTGMRRAIARRVTESTTTVPHFFLTADSRVDELLELRRRINARAGGVKVSVNDFVVKALAAALTDVPDANVIWTPEATRRFETVDLGIAVSIPGGLVTPVLRGAEQLSIGQIGVAVRELAERGRAGRLKQHELEGGSFAVSNLGMYGTRQFSAIINPPHSGILAVGAAQRRPVVGDDDRLAVASVLTVTLSADHRVLDGALAAQLLAAFVARIEDPLSFLV